MSINPLAPGPCCSCRLCRSLLPLQSSCWPEWPRSNHPDHLPKTRNSSICKSAWGRDALKLSQCKAMPAQCCGLAALSYCHRGTGRGDIHVGPAAVLCARSAAAREPATAGRKAPAGRRFLQCCSGLALRHSSSLSLRPQPAPATRAPSPSYRACVQAPSQSPMQACRGQGMAMIHMHHLGHAPHMSVSYQSRLSCDPEMSHVHRLKTDNGSAARQICQDGWISRHPLCGTRGQCLLQILVLAPPMYIHGS